MVQDLRPQRDRGAETVEWGAALLMVATILAVLVGPLLPQTAKDGMEYAVCRVFNFNSPGECESPADKRLKPEACNVSTSVDNVGGNVSVAIVDVGADVTLIRTTDSQGRVTITAVAGGSLGVGTGVGVGINAGNAVNIGADASIHGGVKVGIGDSWQFNSAQEAEQFLGEFKKTLPGSVADSGPLGLVSGSLLSVTDPPRIRDSDIERFEVELGADAGITAGFGVGPANNQPATNRREKADRRTGADQPGADVKPNLNAYATIEGGQKAIVEKNKRTGETSVTMQVSGAAKAGANYVVDGVQARGEVQGAVKLTYDRSGNLSKLTLTRTAIVNDRSEVATTELPIRDDRERAIVYRNLLADETLGAGLPGGGTALRLTFDDMAPDTPPGADATPLQQLLYDKGKTSKVQYDYDADNKSYGANVKFGLKLGLGVNINNGTQNATGGQYLGAPGANGRQWKNFQQCRA